MNGKIKKKPVFILTLILVLALMFSLSACGKTGGGQKEPSGSPPAGSQDGAEPSTPPQIDEPADETDETTNAPSDQPTGEPADGQAGETGGGPHADTGNDAETPTYSGNGEETTADSNGGEETAADSIVALARSLIGAPYEWGAAGPDTFDNSGFVYYCFKENGITLPRKTSEMFASGKAVEREALLSGDLVFFTYNEDRSASYVGIYIGGGEFIAENSEERPVSIHDMTLDYYTRIYVGARRYL